MIRCPALATLLFLTSVAALFGLSACATDLPGDPPELDRLEFPVGIALHPNGRYLYVVNANFNLRYRTQDGGTLVVFDLDTGEIVEESTRTFASFATDIELNHDASRGYIAVRGDSAVAWFSLDAEGRTPRCPLASGGRSLERCRIGVPAEPTALAVTRSSRTTPLTDAAGNPIVDEQGRPQVVEHAFDLLGVAHLREGLVSVVTVVDPPDPSARPAVSTASAPLVDGPNAIAVYEGERFFVTGRSASAVIGFRPAIGADASVQGLSIDTVLSVPTPFNAFQGRALLFSPERDRLYVTNQSPNSLLVFDTSEGDNDSVSGRHNRIIAGIDLPRGPDTMAWLEVPQTDGPTRRVMLISAFDEDRVLVFDPSGPFIIHDFAVGNGPFDIVVDQRHRQRAYVSNFAEHSISVIDLSDPLRPVEIGVLAGPSVAKR